MIELHSLKHDLGKAEHEVCVNMDGDVYITAEDASHKFLYKQFLNLKTSIKSAYLYPVWERDTYWPDFKIWYSQSAAWSGRQLK